MKKKISISIGIILIMLTIAGILTNYADSGRVTTGHEPMYAIKVASKDGSKVTYWGLGYKVICYVGVSPNEPYENHIGVKMGNWFMKYNLPNEKSIQIEYDGKIIEISNYDDINQIYNIVVNSKYDSGICNGINTHKITIDKQIYYLKEACQEIQKGDKQSKISKEDLDSFLKIIESYQ